MTRTARHSPFTVSFLHTFIFCALLAFAANAAAWPARVDHVADGDTLTVVNTKTNARVRVRLHGIDAPEIAHGRNRPGQPYGKTSTDALTRLLDGARVTIEPTGGRSYDRAVAIVRADGRDVATSLVAAGLAWDSTKYDRAGKYAAPQAKARKQSRGLWQASNPVAPWDWRDSHWTR